MTPPLFERSRVMPGHGTALSAAPGAARQAAGGPAREKLAHRKNYLGDSFSYLRGNFFFGRESFGQVGGRLFHLVFVAVFRLGQEGFGVEELHLYGVGVVAPV